MKYIVDIDGTICSQTDGDYTKALPIVNRINKINKLYDEGHQIIYFTARGMGRYQNDANLARARFYQITELQLKMWGCKYHELILGKPSGDYYIDDKGIDANDFFRN
jgi:phosphatidate phosphatase PAH1